MVLALFLALAVGAGVFWGASTLLGGQNSGPVGAVGALVAVSIFFIVFVSMQAGAERMDVSRRVQLVRNRDKREKKSRHTNRIVAQQTKLATKAAQSIVRYLGISGDKMPAVKLQLLKAGFIGENALFYYTVAKVVMPIIGLGGGFAYGMWHYPGDALYIGVCTISGALLASFLIEFVLKSRAKQRLQRIWEDFPDSIDLLVIYTETGATLDTALPRIVQEIKDNSQELALEFEILSTELRLQTDRVKAYDNLVKRAEMPSIKSFVSIVKQSEMIGTPVTKALSALSVELRRERMLIAERRAARVPVLITLPLMLCIMPALFLIVLGPTGIRLYDMIVHWKN
jgi:tight adherence protein C